ncbi:MAG: helix-turn-helix domain-containing protein [Sulfuritalea sp.]|nr:helix-turn-helix domain-containing protein [Sulfuritalea sp.]
MCMTTATIAAADRVDYWRESLKTMFRAECSVEPVRGSQFSAGMSLNNFGAMNLVDIFGSAFGIRRHGIADESRAFILIQLEGNCIVRQEGREARLTPGDLCILPGAEEMEIERRDDFRQISLNLPVERLSDLCPDWKSLATTTVAGDSCCAGIFAATMKSMLDHSGKIEAASRSGLGEAAICMLGAVANAVAGREVLPRLAGEELPSRLEAFHRERIKRFIRDNLCRPELDAAMIAEGVGLSLRSIHRLFEKEPMRLMQWVWEQRLTTCHQHLLRRKQSGLSVSQIAYAAGFNDQAHFSRAFRRRFGASPRSV